LFRIRGRGVVANGCRVFEEGDKNLLIIVGVANSEYTKNLKIVF
jgi:hypothetical protein